MAQETVRMMLHVSERLNLQHRLSILEDFTARMLGAGYSRLQVRHCITSGLTTYEKRRASAENKK